MKVLEKAITGPSNFQTLPHGRLSEMKSLLKSSSLVVLAAALSGFAASASAQEVLNVYNWSDYIGEETVANFEKEYGVKVNYDVYDSNQVVEAKLLAGNSG